jgi:hypothetical protein
MSAVVFEGIVMVDKITKQRELAQRLGITDFESMTWQQLRNAISRAPATNEQKSFLTALLKFKKLPTPEGELTYGRAEELLRPLAAMVNDGVLMEKQWTEGTVVQWKNEYYLIVKIHTHFMFTIKAVELIREMPGGTVEIRDKGEHKSLRHPFTLADDGAVKIDPDAAVP